MYNSMKLRAAATAAFDGVHCAAVSSSVSVPRIIKYLLYQGLCVLCIVPYILGKLTRTLSHAPYTP
jgi:hypothetical protein